MPLQITTEGGLLRFSGDTFGYKDMIKALPGAKWHSAEKIWTAPADADIRAIEARMDEFAYWSAKTAHLRLPREDWTKEQWKAYCLDWNKRGSPGRCCSKATAFEQYEQGPTCWRCERHGETISNWTGD